VIPLVGLAFGIYATLHNRAARLLPGIAAITDAMARARKRTLEREIPDPA
jgi:hypothetical protein